MEIDPTLRAIILVSIMVGLVLLIYFELRYMRKRRKPKVDAQLAKDEAYNSLVTSRAVARVLDGEGKDISRAEQLIFQAENAYSRGEYFRTKQLASEAKRELESSREIVEPEDEGELDKIISKGVDEKKGEAVEKKTLYEGEKNLPDNYLQAKFMIKNVEREVDRAKPGGTITREVEELLRTAVEHFDIGDYTEALRYACKAEKIFSITETQFIGAARDEKPAQIEEPRVTAEETSQEEELDVETVTIAEIMVCSKCGSVLEKDDVFCNQCGARVERKCSYCGNILKEDDVFCRKCGTRVN